MLVRDLIVVLHQMPLGMDVVFADSQDHPCEVNAVEVRKSINPTADQAPYVYVS